MDRIVTVLFRNKLKKIGKLAKNTLVVIFSVLVVFFCFNFVVLINNAESRIPSMNQSLNFGPNDRKYTCYEPKNFFIIWDIVHIIMYSLLPFSIIFIENISLSLLTIRHAKQMIVHCKSMSYPLNKPLTVTSENSIRLTLSERVSQLFNKKKRTYRKSVNVHSLSLQPQTSVSSSDKKRSIIINDRVLILQARRSKQMQSKGFHVANLLLFLTVSFFFTTVPYSTFYALKLNLNLDLKSKNIIIGLLAILQYTRHSANFLIYLFTSSIIKNEIRVIIQNFKRKFFAYNF